MTSIQQNGPFEPELVLVGVIELRWRIQQLIGEEWDSFSRELDFLCARAAAATGEEQEQLVDDVLRLGYRSAAATVFEEIVAHATTPADMKRLTEEIEFSAQREAFQRRAAEEEVRRQEEVQRQMEAYDSMLRPSHRIERHSTRSMPPLEGAATESGTERPRPYEEAAADSDAERPPEYEEATADSEAEPQQIELPTEEIDHGRPIPEPPRANGGARRKAKRARAKAKGAARPKAKRTARAKTRRPSHPRAARPRRAATKRHARAGPQSPRFVNLSFANSKGHAIAKTKPLVAKETYTLRVGIGELARESVVENAAANPLRDDLLPPNPQGHWLQLAVVSNQFKVSPLGRWLFLPSRGPAWTCKCEPGGAHRCKEDNRRSDVDFPVRAPNTPGRATLRLTVYFQKSILQSLLVSAMIARATGGRGSNRAVIDYNLTNSLRDLELVRPRALSVMMNDGDDGSHTLVFNGAPKEVAAVHLTDGQMTASLAMMREVMRSIHIEDRGPNDADKVNRYDALNRKPRDKFIADLKELAARGYGLWHSLWFDKTKRWIENRALFVEDSDVIHIGRKSESTSAFPWAMVYGLPIDIGAPENNHLCRLLEENEWKKFQNAADDVPARCPFEATHGKKVICPYGFWGIRYEIEQPPSLKKGRSLPRSIPVEPPPLNLVVALSDDLDPALSNTHLKVLRAQHAALVFRECRTRNEIRDGLGISDIGVVYFYCHGNTIRLPGNAGTITSLGVGKKQAIVPPDLTTWLMDDWTENHWQTTAPLVFINGCHTADTTPQTLVNFVDTFAASLDAAGVIGTEITVHQLVANEVAQTFLKGFQRGYSVGKSLRQARGGLLRKGNLLGLVYTAYCSADLQLSAAVP